MVTCFPLKRCVPPWRILGGAGGEGTPPPSPARTSFFLHPQQQPGRGGRQLVRRRVRGPGRGGGWGEDRSNPPAGPVPTVAHCRIWLPGGADWAARGAAGASSTGPEPRDLVSPPPPVLERTLRRRGAPPAGSLHSRAARTDGVWPPRAIVLVWPAGSRPSHPRSRQATHWTVGKKKAPPRKARWRRSRPAPPTRRPCGPQRCWLDSQLQPLSLRVC